MGENEGGKFDGEAGVIPSLLPDNAPSGERVLLPLTLCQCFTEADRKKMEEGGNWRIGGANIILVKTTGSNMEKNEIKWEETEVKMFSNTSHWSDMRVYREITFIFMPLLCFYASSC